MQLLAFILLLNCSIWPWLLIPLLLLSWFLGWLFGSSKGRKLRSRIDDLELNLRKSTAKNTELEKEVSGLRFDYNKIGKDNKEVRNQLADTELELNNSQKRYRDLELQKSDWEQAKLLNVGAASGSGISDEEHEALKLKLNNLERDYASLQSSLDAKTSDYNALYSKYGQLDRDNSVAKDKLAATERALKACEEKAATNRDSQGIVSSEKASDDAKNTGTPPVIMPLTKSETPIVREPIKAQSGMGANFKSTNLQIIEGVGPKIEGLLKNAGYGSWGDIAKADISDLQKVLDDAGPRYRIHNPQKWSDQARFAANGQWDELVKYQKWLDVGDEGVGGQSKVEKLYFKSIGFAAAKPNDLKVVEGIGPKIESLLKAAGINSWSDLASSSVQRIQEILTAAGDRYRLADPKTWPKQAELAANGKWTELKEYQDFLSGGKE